jgi:hypothetical protein
MKRRRKRLSKKWGGKNADECGKIMKDETQEGKRGREGNEWEARRTEGQKQHRWKGGDRECILRNFPNVRGLLHLWLFASTSLRNVPFNTHIISARVLLRS